MTIFIDPELISGRQQIKVPREKARYLLSVLRCREGDAVAVIDGRGRAYEATVVSIIKKDVFIDITGELFLDSELPVPLVLCQGMLKGEKMDLIIQKSTELGIAEIVPLVTERSIVKETRKMKRWHSIAEEAAEQCGRAVIPAIRTPVQLTDMLAGKKVNGLFFREHGGMGLPEALKTVDRTRTVHLFIGPEGGFTADEVCMAEKNGIAGATLGKRILRSETAAIAAATLVQFLLSEGRAKGGAQA